VHEDAPVVFQTRWVMSYLRGPLTRPEIKRLMGGVQKPAPAVAAPVAASAASSPSAASSGLAAAAPVLPPEISQRFLAVRTRPDDVVYEPHLFAAATVHYVEEKKGIDHAEDVSLLAPLGGEEVDWYAAEAVDVAREDLESEPVAGARFAPLPDDAVRAKSYDGWRRELEECLFRSRRCEVFRSPGFGELSMPGETERDFRIRLGDLARERRDEQVEALRKKHGPKVAMIEERIRRAEHNRQKQEEQARHQTWSTVMSAGTAVLGALFGRKTFSSANLGRASSAMRGAGRAFQERQDVSRAEENLETLKKQLADLDAELQAEIGRLEERLDPEKEELEVLALKPRRKDVEVRFLTLAWAPKRGGEPAWG
jgi:hypothetical protein